MTFPPLLSRRLLALILILPLAAQAETWLVENGQPRAQIVIAKDPPRTTRLAAHELQTYIEKISGTKLPIVNEPKADLPIKIGVGRNALTEKLKIDARDLRAGAYRIVSGDDWLVLIGDDTDFTPIEPWAKNDGESVSGKMQSEWDKITGGIWGVPNSMMFKHRIRLPGDIGQPTARPSLAKSSRCNSGASMSAARSMP